ncbi:hypothetical protein [Negadavirga shengliensis]|uniref:PorV/PorQ family protein n=1 Tax=Negadavirga shengliensis TaxID=1389218 RepID=A0ABV9SYS9_9BACT
MKRCFFLLLLQCPYILAPALGQNGTVSLPKGARSTGMGHAHVTISDAWAVFNNIGALGMAPHQTQVIAGYDHRMGLDELTTLVAGITAPFRESVAFGIGLSTYGGELFNQQNIGMGISNKMGIASLGLKINYFQTNIEGYGRQAAPVLELGGTAQLGPHFFFGAHVYNFSRSRLSKITSDYLPTVIKTGISYRPSENLMVNVESEKEILLPAQFKTGIEYNVHKALWTRTGINTQPNHLFFGIGFKPQKYQFDYALSRHFTLGFTHHFSFNYLLSEN